MQTVYDWITVAIFAGLIVLFLQRSTTTDHDRPPDDPLWLYLAAGAGCAVTNYLGNKDLHLLAILALAATLAGIFKFLQPFKP